MAERRRSRHWRFWSACGLTAVLVGYALYAMVWEEDGPGEAAPLIEPPPDDGKLRVTEVDPVEAHPGDALTILLSGATGTERLHVLVSNAQFSKEEAEILHESGSRVVVKLPSKFVAGTAKLRVAQGERQSKPFEFRIEPVPWRKLLRNVIGGLALFVYGLYILSKGLRQYAGHRVRGFLGRLTGESPLAVLMGVPVGMVTQLTTTASGLLVGLLEPQLIALGPAVAVLVGTQLGAAATVAVLPLASAREGLLVMAIGVAWVILSMDRRGKAFGNAILGGGLLFYGLHLLRIGFEPMIADPQILSYVGMLRSAGVAGYVACGLAGAVLASLLQGPGPVFGLVLGLVQSTGVLDLTHALAILAGTNLGAAIDTAVVAWWPYGRDARRLAVAHLIFAGLATVAILVTVPLWAWLADVLVAGDPGKIAYGKRVLLPHLGKHLVAGFLVSQLFAAVLAALVLPMILRLARRLVRQRAEPRPSKRAQAEESIFRVRRATAGVEGVAVLARVALGRALRSQLSTLQEAFTLCRIGDRSRGVTGEYALKDARAEVVGLLPRLVGTSLPGEEVGRLRRAALATLQMGRSIDDLLRLAERGLERHSVFSEVEEAKLRPAHDLVLEGINELINGIERGDVPDIERARAREIRLNAREASGRQELIGSPEVEEQAVTTRLRLTEILDAYENVGNHLYRVFESLTSDVDEAVA